MPMIDVYAAAGTFVDKNKLAQDLANAVMKWEGVPSTDLLKKNTAAFVHELPSDAISNAAGDNNYVRVQVLTPVNVLNREKQVGVVRELTDIVAAAAAIEPWRTGLGYSSRNLRMVVGDQRPRVHQCRHCRLRPCRTAKFASNVGFLKRTLAPHLP